MVVNKGPAVDSARVEIGKLTADLFGGRALAPTQKSGSRYGVRGAAAALRQRVKREGSMFANTNRVLTKEQREQQGRGRLLADRGRAQPGRGGILSGQIDRSASCLIRTRAGGIFRADIAWVDPLIRTGRLRYRRDLLTYHFRPLSI